MLLSQEGTADKKFYAPGNLLYLFMAEMCKLLKVRQIQTSIYHPQTDVPVEQVNQTLKQMFKKMIDADGKNWLQL